MRLAAVAVLTGAIVAPGVRAAALSADRLADGFAAPPADAKPQVWWHWNNGNISKEGITADLEAMASAGIGGAHIFDVDSGTPLGSVRFNTPAWDAMVLHAHREAQRLGLKLTLANCSGYSSSGGPWVTAADAMKCVTWTETAASGGRRLSLALPQPADRHGWYRDIAVFAVRRPAAERHLMDEPGAKVERTSPAKNTYRYDIVLPRKAKASAFTYTTESSVVWGHTVEAVVECRGADGAYREVGRAKDFVCYGGSVNRLPRFANFPEAESDAWRLTFTFAGYVPERCRIVAADLGEFQRFHDLGKKVLDAPSGQDSFSPLADTVDPRFAIGVKDVIPLNDRFGDGKLEWDAPEGEWTILRIGAAANGTVCAPATPGGVGFEVDKFDREALRRHFDAFVGRIAKMCDIDPKSDPAKRSGIVASLIDSYEVGGQNWTARFPEEFRRRRGYDVVCAYLPALTGRIIGSVAETDRFLADFRETCAELFREEYAQAFTEYCHASGLQSVVESYGDAPAPRFTFADECDLPMTEFWLYGVDRVQVPNAVTGVVAQARRNGRRIVQSESFTSFPADDDWKQPLWAYKAQGDRIYAAGVNRIVYHRFAHQPWVDVHKRPGMTMGAWGTHFERTQTYWPYVGDWIRYQSRCQFLLQEGEFVRADASAEPAWTCRRYEDGSMGWFVASTSDVPHRVCIDLGSVPAALKRSVPEIWDPETGLRQQAASFEWKGDRLCVNVDFEWRDSVFVMLRPARLESAPYHGGSPRHVQATVPVAGSWEVAFDREMGGPGQVEFPSLVSWPDRSEPGIRYYSGTAVYRKTVPAPERKAGERLELDLGEVRDLAQVKVNGKALPVLWKKPYRVDITEAAEGAKELEIEIDVVNLWPNRMIGDAALPKEKRYTFSVYEPWKANDQPLPSGLLGPVRFNVLSSRAEAFEVRQVLERPQYTRGNVNVRIAHPIDEAAWVWMPGHEMWGVASDADAWNVRYGTKEHPFAFFRFRNGFESDGSPLRFAVSADERFVLFLDGRPVARGPQRGLVEHWYYQSYEITGLAPGRHLLEAVCWQLGVHAPLAQLSYRGGFVLRAEGRYDAALTTGKGRWEVAPLAGTAMTDRGTSETFGVGTQCRSTGTGFTDERPAESAWRPAAVVRAGVAPNCFGGRTKGWMLYPADRPDQVYETKVPGRAVNVRQDLTRPFTVPAHTTLDVWWDLDDYYCAYPEVETRRGKGATVTWGWAESLREPDGKKGNRDEWKGKSFDRTLADTFVCDGREKAFFTSPWWRCGRWCRVTVRTADEPLEVSRIAIGETRYPLAVDASFACDDATLGPVLRISRRAMESCMHEMLFDCPYYEQQMYPGDTRVQLQILNALTRDDRMARFVLSAFDFDRRSDGLVAMNFPTRGTQESATYTMCWILMFGDYLLWHDDPAFLRLRMPGVRNALMGLSVHENADGLLENLPGWSFMDWVYGDQPFTVGVAPDGDVGQGVSALNNLLYLLALQSAASVDEALGEGHLAEHWRTKAARLGRTLLARFWDEGRGALADTVRKDRFSEHAQCLAILSGILAPARRDRAFAALAKGEGLAPASSYFAYYVFEAFARCGRADLVMRRLDFWRNFVAHGARTAFETQDPAGTRSDCHAWSASPAYFVHTAFAGVRPSSPFFRTVRVAPQPAGLKEIRAKTPCPQGLVETDLRFAAGGVRGTVVLPDGLSGEFVWNGRTQKIVSGENRIERK